MVQLRIIQGEDRQEVDVPNEMLNATDEQIIGYVQEQLHRTLPEDITIEKTAEAIILHPKAVYG